MNNASQNSYLSEDIFFDVFLLLAVMLAMIARREPNSLILVDAASVVL